VMEQWNSVNGFIFSGRGGELLSNRPEDQEIAVLSLHLIQVSLALINTLMLQDVLAEEKWKASFLSAGPTCDNEHRHNHMYEQNVLSL
jgi:TnpA family transposase